jgi:antitoxin component YwqK of YwqJK toxin-antitoxin module
MASIRSRFREIPPPIAQLVYLDQIRVLHRYWMLMFMLINSVAYPNSIFAEDQGPPPSVTDSGRQAETPDEKTSRNDQNQGDQEQLNETKVKPKAQPPLPTNEDIGGTPPTSADLYPKSRTKKEKRKCKRKKGRWINNGKGLQGCLIKRKKEGIWIYQDDSFLQGVISFKNDQPDGEMWSFSLEGIALEVLTYKEGKKEGVHRKWGAGGQLKLVENYKDNLKHGVAFEWHIRSCIPAQRGAFKEGKPSGPWMTWYITGAPKEKGSYKEGKKQGLWSFYHQEGNKIREGQMEQGIEVGVWKEWLHTGQTWRDVTYIKGVRQGVDELKCVANNGEWLVDYKERTESCMRFGYQMIIAQKLYYESGALMRRNPYNLKGEQSGLMTSFHPTGELLVSGELVGGRPEGMFTYLTRAGEPMGPSSTITQGTGDWRSYHHTGKLAEKGRWLLGRPVGQWQTFYDHGALESTMIYSEGGIREGSYERFYRDGTPETRGQFGKNARQGVWQFYYMNGQVAVEANFVDSARSGDWREWYWLSSPKVQGRYRNNKKSGEWLEYHNNGELSGKGTYSSDEKAGQWTQNWYTGSHWRNVEFTAGVSDDPDESACGSLSGKWTAELKERYAGCNVCRVSADGAQKFVKTGLWRWWHPNGELEREGVFSEDQAHGPWREYNRQGKLTLSGQYEHGDRVGVWRGYYPEGQLQYQGHFNANGGEEGEWITYHQGNQIESRGVYTNGLREGLWLWWSQTGSLQQLGRFESIKDQSKSESTEAKESATLADIGHKSVDQAKEHRVGLWLSWHDNCQIRTSGRYETGKREGKWRWWKRDGSGWRSEQYLKSRAQKRLLPPGLITPEDQKRLGSLCETFTPQTKAKQSLLQSALESAPAEVIVKAQTP